MKACAPLDEIRRPSLKADAEEADRPGCNLIYAMSKKEVKQIKALEEAMAELVAKARLSARHTSATLLRVAVAALVAEAMPRDVALIALRECLTDSIIFFNNERSEREKGNT